MNLFAALRSALLNLPPLDPLLSSCFSCSCVYLLVCSVLRQRLPEWPCWLLTWDPPASAFQAWDNAAFCFLLWVHFCSPSCVLGMLKHNEKITPKATVLGLWDAGGRQAPRESASVWRTCLWLQERDHTCQVTIGGQGVDTEATPEVRSWAWGP